MRTLLLFLSALALGLSPLGAALPSATPINNPRITGSGGEIPSGGTLTVKSGGSLIIESGATYTVPAAGITWASVSKTSSSLADLATRSASDLSSGTLPDARFPATLPAASGANLTALTAGNITGVIPIANLATGTPDGTKFLRDDGTLVTPSGSGTVTHTAGALTEDAVVLGAGAADTKVLASLGTSGQVLTSAGAGAPPTWEDAASGSGTVTNTGGDLTANAVMLGAGTVDSKVLASLGTSGQVLTSAGAGTPPTWEDATGGSGGGTLTLARWRAVDYEAPLTNYAGFDARNIIAKLNFDAGTAESAIFNGIIPEGADFTTGVTVRIIWSATTATSGDVIWTIAFERMNTDMDADSFATGLDTAAATTSGTSGITTTTSKDFNGTTEIDGLLVGEFFRMKITRKAADGGDTMTGDAELIAVELRQR